MTVQPELLVCLLCGMPDSSHHGRAADHEFVDPTPYNKAPIVADPYAKCDWDGEEGNDEQGPIRKYEGLGRMHAACAWSYQHGGLAAAVRDEDPADVAAREQRMIDNDGEGIRPWYEDR